MPTVPFGLLYCFSMIGHDRRRILHFGVTKHPTSAWVVQQLREAFPYDSSHKYLIFDRDTKFSAEVMIAVTAMGSELLRTSFKSPWQNGVAERWVGSCRRDLLDHVIALNEHNLKRLLAEYVRYYHDDRTHLGLGKETPDEERLRVGWETAQLSPLRGWGDCTIATISQPKIPLFRISDMFISETSEHLSVGGFFRRCNILDKPKLISERQ